MEGLRDGTRRFGSFERRICDGATLLQSANALTASSVMGLWDDMGADRILDD